MSVFAVLVLEDSNTNAVVAAARARLSAPMTPGASRRPLSRPGMLLLSAMTPALAPAEKLIKSLSAKATWAVEWRMPVSDDTARLAEFPRASFPDAPAFRAGPAAFSWLTSAALVDVKPEKKGAVVWAVVAARFIAASICANAATVRPAAACRRLSSSETSAERDSETGIVHQ